MFKILIPVIFLFPLVLKAQYEEYINSDRPGENIRAFTIGSNVFQIESGSFFINDIYDGANKPDISVKTQFRLGVTDRLEIKGMVNWISEPSWKNGESYVAKGVEEIKFGTKLNLLKNKGKVLRYALGFQAMAYSFHSKRSLDRNEFGTEFLLITENRLFGSLIFSTNWGLKVNQLLEEGDSHYVLNFSNQSSGRWVLFMDFYGEFPMIPFHFAAGTGFKITKNFQLDLAIGLSAHIYSRFIDFGMSWRNDWRSKSSKLKKEKRKVESTFSF